MRERFSYSPGFPPDASLVTSTLVFVGYRPYMLRRDDNNQAVQVWAKSAEEVNLWASGTVRPIRMPQGMKIAWESVIVLDPSDRVIATDRGFINDQRVFIPE